MHGHYFYAVYNTENISFIVQCLILLIFSCGFQDDLVNMIVATGPLTLLLPLMCLLYLVTWYHIWRESRRIRDVVGDKAQSVRACHDSAKIMTSFVVAFLVQWWSVAVYGFTVFFGEFDTTFYYVVVTFGNLGGVYNAIVYVLIRNIRQKVNKVQDVKVDSTQVTNIK